jgi:hypothetical protein
MNIFNLEAISQIQILPTIISFVFAIISSYLLREIYLRKSKSLIGKNQIANIIPILSASIFIVIVIIKSSLALSLGLVGALSIVRFRTPIKEPEELVYLFLAIAIGIGYGSGQVVITSVLISIIFILIVFFNSNNKKINFEGYNLIINFKNHNEINNITNLIFEQTNEAKIIRSDISDDQSTIVFNVEPKNNIFLDTILTDLKKIDQEINITFFESSSNW